MTIDIQGLSKVFGTQRAVDNISFSIDKGQILGFLGPNGAGKSTTMKMITSYLKPSEGTVSICGMDSVTQSLETRKLIGYLPEHNPLYTDMYVIEYLRFVSNLHKLPKTTQRINNVIEMVGLGREQHKQIGALSKGYRQRVGLAQALIHDPEILILDEPTSGLDMNQLQDIRKLIKDLGQEKTVIFSTHIMQEVQALCNRVIIINNGKLVADDPIETLTAKVRGESQITVLLKNESRFPIDFQNINGVTKSTSLGNEEYIISYPNDLDLRADIFKYCVSINVPIIGMQKLESNVEDIFQELTKRSENV